jgi:hypothetical protein
MEPHGRAVVPSVQAMDLFEAIRQLYEERARLNRVIASLEEMQKAGAGAAVGTAARGERRGRKGMDAEERRAVSERMKQYWAKRRKKARQRPPDART